MHDSGDDLSKPRDVDFTVVLPNQAAAQVFGDHWRALGYQVSAEESGAVPDLPWDVVVVRHMVPTHAGIAQFEQELEAVASGLGGRNDGWGCFGQ